MAYCPPAEYSRKMNVLSGGLAITCGTFSLEAHIHVRALATPRIRAGRLGGFIDIYAFKMQGGIFLN